jgi:hypothetical protein
MKMESIRIQRTDLKGYVKQIPVDKRIDKIISNRPIQTDKVKRTYAFLTYI